MRTRWAGKEPGGRRWTSLGLAVVLFLTLPVVLLAEGERVVRGFLRFDRISLDEGLSHGQVYSILQDSDGFMWFGTQAGLNRFDGYTFKQYANDPEDPESLSGSWVWSLYQDRRGVLWVGTDDGLNRLVAGSDRFIRYREDFTDPNSLVNDKVQALLEDSRGVLWVGTEGGLHSFDREAGTFTRYLHDPSDPSTLGPGNVRAIYEDRHGEIWVGTKDGGLSRLVAQNGTFVHFTHDPRDPTSLSHNNVRAIQEDGEQRLWVGTYGGGVNRFERDTQTFTRYSLGSNDAVFSVFCDRRGTLWIGTDGNGLNAWDPVSERFVRYRNDPRDETSLSGQFVYSVYQDRGNVIWVGTDRGLSKWNVDTWSFPHFRHDPSDPTSLSPTVVTSFHEDPQGGIWVGTRGGGLDHFDPTTHTFKHYRHDPDDPRSLSGDGVMSLLVDRQGRLWVGTRRNGLNRFDAATGKFVRYLHDPQDPRSLAANGVSDLFEDRSGTLWVASYEGGINRYEPETGTFVRYQSDPSNPGSLSSNKVLVMAEDRRRALWIGTVEGGLNRFDPERRTSIAFRHDRDDPSSLSHDTVFSIHEDSRGVLWVGTQDGGLNALDPQTLEQDKVVFRRYIEGLPNRTVYGILEHEGHLWLSTNNGLSRFDLATEQFKNYDQSHGLQGREFEFGAYYQSVEGRLFFGGPGGFNAFVPRQVRDNEHKPPVVLTKIKVLDEERLPGENGIELTHEDIRVTFEFAALDYTAPEQNQYRYKLEGFDKDWRLPEEGSRVAPYNSLPPKGYTFRVQGSNNDGLWSETEATLSVNVLPAPWKSGWAYTLYALAGVALVLSYARAQRRKLEREAQYSHQLEEEVQARTRELGNRNEELQLVNQRLEEASLTDSLTGLKNRRYVMGYMHRETDPRQRLTEETPSDAIGFLFLMIDMDGLKQINDTYGHMAGDRVLIQVRAILEAACRDSDIISRWGGDEFLVVGRKVHRLAAETLAERIRREVEDYPFDLGIGQTIRLSCSIGVAFYPFIPSKPTLVGWEQVVAIADRALYAAKKSGRNAWVGILSTEKMDQSRPGELVKLINERLDRLVQEGGVELLSSLPSPRSRLAL